MRYLLILLLSLLSCTKIFADNPYEPLLNTVTMQFSAEQWATTKTALVTIGVNATISGSALEKAQNEVLGKLNKIAKGDWHIMSFNRSLDQSGLERVQISAQTRLASSELSGLRDKAKALSVPGETFTLDNVEFIPSAEELREANLNLRNDIYQQSLNELNNLNKLYPDQKFYLHSINFIGDIGVLPQPQPREMMAVQIKAQNLSVGDKLIINATVVFAAAPSEDVAKVVHN